MPYVSVSKVTKRKDKGENSFSSLFTQCLCTNENVYPYLSLSSVKRLVIGYLPVEETCSVSALRQFRVISGNTQQSKSVFFCLPNFLFATTIRKREWKHFEPSDFD